MMNHTNNRPNIIGVVIPTLVMIFVQTHSYPILIISMILSILNLNRPLVLFPSMFITSLNTNYFMIVPGLSCGLVFSILMVISLLLSINNSDSNLSNKSIGWVIVLILFNLMMSLFSVTGSMGTFFIMLENLVVFYLLSIQKTFDIINLLKILAGSVCLCVLIMLWSYLVGGMVETYGGRLTIEGVNENGLAMIYCQCSIVLIFAFFFLNNKLQRIISLLSFFVALYLLFLSGSRSALFGSLAGSISVLLCYQVSNDKKRNIIIPIVFVCLLSYLAFDFLMDSNLPVMERFKMETMIEGRGTNRLDRREYLLTNVFPEHPLFGIGLGGDNEYAISPGPCHNIIIDPIIQIGLVGFFLYWLFISKFLWRTRKYVRQYKEIILPISLFVASFINGMGEVIFFEKFFWNSIAMCVLFSNVLTAEKNKIAINC